MQTRTAGWDSGDMLKRIPWLPLLVSVAMLALGLGAAALAALTNADPSPTPAVQLHLDTLENTSLSPDGTTPMGTTPDSSGNGLNATASGTPVSDGRFQGALSMLYSDNGVTVPDNTVLRPTQVTVMAWVRFSANPGANRLIVGKPVPDNQCGNVSYGLTTGASGGAQFDVTTDHGDTSGGIEQTSTPETDATSIWNGQWHALAGTYDGTTIRLWVDGALAQSTPVGDNLPLVYDTSDPGLTDLYAGQAKSSTGCDESQFRYGGQIDEIRVYGRALSQSEIQYLQDPTATVPPNLPPPSTTSSTTSTTHSTTTTTKSSSTTTTTTPPLAGQPVAHFLVSNSLVLPGATRFSGLSSHPSLGGKITDYHWTIVGAATPTVDTDCGSSPVLSHPFPENGTYHVLLTVTDTLGHRASIGGPVVITGRTLLNATADPRTFDCENPAKGEEPDRADCIKSYGFGILDVNSRGKLDDCFQVTQFRPSPNAKSVDQGTIAGPVAINGLYVPIPESVKTVYDSSGNISVHGANQFSVRIGPFLTQKFPLQFTVKPNSQGVFHLVKVAPAVDTPKFLGSLPVSGSFAIDLTYHQSHVSIGLGLPSPFSFGNKRDASGTVMLISDNVNGLHYDGLGLSVPDLWLGPLFVSNLSFSYTKSTDSWNGTAKVTLPGSQIAIDASGPPSQPPDFGIGIKNGQFDHAGFGVDFTPPTQPDLFPFFHTVLLSTIGGSVGLNPFRLTGQIGISAANLVDETGVLLALFATPDDKYTLPDQAGSQLAPLAGRTFDRFTLAIAGTAMLKVPLIGNQLPPLTAYGLYEYPDYFEFGGGLNFKYGFVKLTGGVSGFVYPSSGKFNVQGGLQGCLTGIKAKIGFFSFDISPCVSVGAVVSTKGIGACGVFPLPTPFGTFPLELGAGYKWGASSPDLMIFSCDYSPYAEASPLAGHIAAGSYAVTLPSGLPSAMFRVHGVGAAPDLRVIDPRGQNITGSHDAVTIQGTDPDTTLVGLKHPLAGRWTITAAAGSAPIADVATAHGLPAPTVHARVTGKGRRRVLHYRTSNLDGRQLTFTDRGPGVAHVLGLARHSTGTIRFTPEPGRGRRSVVGLVEGVTGPGLQLTLASFRAPGFTHPARPASVHVLRRRGSIVVSWKRVPGATRYEVLVRLADHSQVFRVVRGSRAVIADPFSSKRGTVSVDALDRSANRGPARVVPIKAVAVKRPPPRRRRAHH